MIHEQGISDEYHPSICQMVMEMAADFNDAEACKARGERRHPLLSSPITDALLSVQNRVLLGELVVEQGKGKEI